MRALRVDRLQRRRDLAAAETGEDRETWQLLKLHGEDRETQ